MSSGAKPEFQPLLPPGRHTLSLTALQMLCLDRLGRPSTRDQIFAALELLVADLAQWGICCELWIDGSFMTEKHDPDDADLTIVIEGEVFYSLDISLQNEMYTCFNQKNYHEKLHTFAIVTVPRDHPQFDLRNGIAASWSEWWQVSRENWLKGMAVIRLGENDVGIRILS